MQATDTNTPVITSHASQDTLETKDEVIEILFRVGWNLETFLAKNGLPMSEANSQLWLATSRQASADQLHRMQKHFVAGFRTVAKRGATWNKKEQRWDTKETISVTTPGCDDDELLTEAFDKAQRRAAKELGEKLQAAVRQGAESLKGSAVKVKTVQK